MSDPPTPVPARRGPGRPRGSLDGPNTKRRYRGQTGFSAVEIKAALEANFYNARMTAIWLNDKEKRIALEIGGVQRRTINAGKIRNFIERRHLQFKIRAAAKEEILDLAEQSAINLLRKNHPGITGQILRALGGERGYRIGDTLLVLDPSRLTVEQLLQVLNPERMSDEQINAVIEMWGRFFDFTSPAPNGSGPIIDHEPLMLQEPPDAATDQVSPI